MAAATSGVEGFGDAVPAGGYAWWYFDAISDDGERALTAIFFRGSVFSPWYAARLRRGEPAAADDHLAVNLALYDRRRRRAWVMSEYGAGELGRADGSRLEIARSFVNRAPGGGLTLGFVERSAPLVLVRAGLGSPVEGTVEIEPLAPAIPPVELAPGHLWQVPVPRAHIRARMRNPRFELDGTGYHDLNRGDGPLASGFSHWRWARFHEKARTVVLFSAQPRAGSRRGWIYDSARSGEARPARVAPGDFALDDGARRFRCRLARDLERAPFYARFGATLEIDGDGGAGGGAAPISGLGERLDLDLFRLRVVQSLLPYRIRKVG